MFALIGIKFALIGKIVFRKNYVISMLEKTVVTHKNMFCTSRNNVCNKRKNRFLVKIVCFLKWGVCFQ